MLSAPRPRLKADTQHLDELVARAVAGRIRVPEFQRGLKWRTEDVLKLFDSIYRGYPIGTILLWRRHSAQRTVYFGPVVVRSTVEDAWDVVDGQQRITSLVAALHHPEEPDVSGPFCVYCDLEGVGGPRFFRPSRLRPAHGTHLPMNRILGPAFQEWLLELVAKEGRRDLVPVASEVQTRLRNYRVPIYEIDEADLESVRDIFLRTNSAGRRMEAHEVFAAFTTAPGVPTPARTAERLSSRFGPIEPNVVVKSVRALYGDNVTTPEASRADSPDAGAIAVAETALERAFLFIAEAGIPHARLLPAQVTPPVVLARLLGRHREVSARDTLLLRRWLWRGIFHEALGSDAATLRRAVLCVGDGNATESVQALLRRVPSGEPGAWLLERFDARHGLSRLAMLVVALAEPAPIGAPDSDSSFDWLQQHGVQTFTRWPGAENRPEARFFTPGVPSVQLRAQVLDWAREDVTHPSLATHLLTPEAASAALRGETAELLHRRRETILEAGRKLYHGRAEPRHGDRPSIEVL